VFLGSTKKKLFEKVYRRSRNYHLKNAYLFRNYAHNWWSNFSSVKPETERED
jgi:hypothetical protein